MRIIAGSARGRRLEAPKGRTVRPTSDRVREALFSSLRDEVPRAAVLDLFAGTGALGIEALSRAAASATFVEREPAVVQALRRNIATAGVEDRALVVRADATGFVDRPRGGPFTLVFADPPYDQPFEMVVDLLVRLHTAGGLAHPAIVVVERDKRDPALADLDGAEHVDARGLLAIDRQRSYGDTVLLYLRTQKTAV
jgi:16S rRNA (guanine966-N2)-methyltransferase